MLRRSVARLGVLRATVALRGSKEFSEDPDFEKYFEVDNANGTRVAPLRMNSDEWVATEKVHGANFGIYVMDNGATMKFAKRTAFLGEHENFFGFHVLKPQLQSWGMEAYRQLKTYLKVDSLDTMIIFGELFGGKYFHQMVPRSKQTYMLKGQQRQIMSVQREPFPQYTPDLAFYAFDIKFKLSKESKLRLMTYDQGTSIFEKVPGLLYQKALVRGPLEKLLAFDVESFNTTVPQHLGFGDFYMRGNISEGVVLRHHMRGHQATEGKTTMLKMKCTAFNEMKADRTAARVARDPMAEARQLAIDKYGPQLPVVEAVFPTKAQQRAAKKLLDHVCDSRLNNFLSKIGNDPIANGEMTSEKVAFALAADALKDFLKDETAEVVNLPLTLRREMGRHCLAEARKLVAKQWNSIQKNASATTKEA